jgi:hypothetical protein
MVATSATPTGPFGVVTPSARMDVKGGGDFALIIDGGAAYIAYDAWANQHTVTVQRLADDFRDATPGASTGALSPSNNEAPAIFRRGAFFYLLYGHTCCFCKGGAGARVSVASHPMGPWIDTGVELNPGPTGGDHVIPAQNNFVIALNGSAGAQFIFTADMWSSAPDGLKSHDLQYWSPLSFDDSLVPPAIAPLKWIDSFTLTL